MNAANKKTDQSLSVFQTGIGVASHDTFDMEQLISHERTALVDPIASLQDSEGGVIPFQEALELLTKIHEILYNDMSKWVGNTVCIEASHFKSASRQHSEVRALQYPLLYNFKDSVPPSEVCLYGHINWPQVLTQQQSSYGLSESSTFMRGGRTRPGAGFQFNVQKQHVAQSSGGSVAKKPHSDTRTESSQ